MPTQIKSQIRTTKPNDSCTQDIDSKENKTINPVEFLNEKSAINPIEFLDRETKINPVVFGKIAPKNNILKGINTINNPNINSKNDTAFLVGINGHLYSNDQGIIMELSNFNVIPKNFIISDDGLHQSTSYVITCVLENDFEEKTICISAYSLRDFNWIINQLSLKYYIASYSNAYTMFSIYLSKQFLKIKPEYKYDMVGWKYLNNKYVYLHGLGAIGSSNKNLKGSVDKKIEIDESLNAYTSFERSLTLLNMSNNIEKTLPLFLYSHLAIMKEIFTISEVEPKLLLWVYGLTGSMKTSVCKIFFNIFNRQSRPIISATFKDTSSAFEIKAFEYKDSVLLLDDYHPTTSSTEKKSMEALASHVLRMYGDGITKSRATKTMCKQKESPPRGLCVITGEDKLGGESTVARYIGIEVCTNEYKTDILSFHQKNPLIFSTHLYYFINWISDNFKEISAFIKANFENYRNTSSRSFKHKRLSDSYAILQITANLLIEYSVQIGYLDPTNVNAKSNEWSNILLQVIRVHEQSNVEDDPAIMYLKAIGEMISSNKCVLLSKDDTSINKSNVLGYEDNEFYYLIPGTAFGLVRTFWKGQGLEFPVSNEQLNKALDILGVIKTENESGKIKRTIKATLGKLGRKRYLTISIKRMTDILNNM